MIITNKYNLPSALVNLAQEKYEPKNGRFGVTSLLNPTRIELLKRRHYNEITTDVSDMIWLIFGSAVHNVLESHDTTGYAELKYEKRNI